MYNFFKACAGTVLSFLAFMVMFLIPMVAFALEGTPLPDAGLPPEAQVGIVGMLAMATKFFLDMLKNKEAQTLLGKLMPIELVPLLSLGLGVVAALLAKVVGGQTWLMAALYGAVPALAVFLDQLFKTLSRMRGRKAVEAVAAAMSDEDLEKAVTERAKRALPDGEVSAMTDAELEAAFRRRASNAA